MPVTGVEIAPEADGDLSPDTFAADPPTLTTTIGRRGPDGKVVTIEVAYAEIDGKAIYQGDILLGDAETVASRERVRKSTQYGLVITTAGGTWPGGVLPFLADAGTAGVVAKVAAHLAARTGVRMKPRTDEDDFVRFVTSGSSESKIGRQGGEQVISLRPGSTMGTALHETCHALGLWHEQCRRDRDGYITVVAANVLAGCMPQFAVQDTDVACIGPYDYRSIMHYGPSQFGSPPGAITITARNGESIGQRDGLSPGDVAALRALYP